MYPARLDRFGSVVGEGPRGGVTGRGNEEHAAGLLLPPPYRAGKSMFLLGLFAFATVALDTTIGGVALAARAGGIWLLASAGR